MTVHRGAFPEHTALAPGRRALLARAQRLAGYTLGELGIRHGVPVPDSPARAKGLAGRLLERALGAHAGHRPVPDFPRLGVELKTIPLDRHGRPRESTFVGKVALREVQHQDWPTSRAREKLRCVLWVPIEATPDLPLPKRRVGHAHLWSPSPTQEAGLRADWEDLVELIASGRLDLITGHLGRYLQLRPKAAHGRVRTLLTDEDGAPRAALPLGFYLRASFTRRVLAELKGPIGPKPTGSRPAALDPRT